MVNDRHQADDEVAATLALAMSNKDGLLRYSDIRLSLFAILRKCIAQNALRASGDAGAVFPAEGDSATAIDKAVMQLISGREGSDHLVGCSGFLGPEDRYHMRVHGPGGQEPAARGGKDLC
jgi:hypothetical protein